MTSYCDDDHSSVDSPFGVHVHHPRFLEWVGAPEWARLLSRPPADTMYAVLQWFSLELVRQEKLE